MKTFQLLLLTSLIFLLTECKKTHLTNDICDCANSQSIYVIDTITLTIPNLFTPNDDGINDCWEIINIDKFPDSKIKVSKPGLLGGTVFESSVNTQVWNGENNGHNLKDGKYKYEITVNGQTYTGYVCIYNGLTQPKNSDCLKECTTIDHSDPVVN